AVSVDSCRILVASETRDGFTFVTLRRVRPRKRVPDLRCPAQAGAEHDGSSAIARGHGVGARRVAAQDPHVLAEHVGCPRGRGAPAPAGGGADAWARG